MIEFKAVVNGTDMYLEVSKATLDLMGLEIGQHSYAVGDMAYICLNRDSAKFEKTLRQQGVKWKLVF